MRHPGTGEWVLLHTFDEVSFSLSEFARTGENLAEVLNTHPLLMKLGHGEAPAMRRSNYEDVAMLEYDGSYLEAALEAGGEWFKAGDWRPFAWKGQVWLAHWIIFAPGEERMAISSLDETTGDVHLAHVLSPIPGPVEVAQRVDGRSGAEEAESLSAVEGSSFAREKNWGLAEDRSELLVFHALLPCTVVLAFDLNGANVSAPGPSAHVASRTCFAGAAAAAATATGLDILHHPIHGSGNPVPWDIERGAEYRELLGMLHVKRGDYAHWAVRIDCATRRVTHVSAGPVIKARDYRNEGFLDSALVVGSFHMLDRLGEEGPERVVRILYGEGDRFGCWLDVAADAIVWHALGEPDAGAVAPPSVPPVPAGNPAAGTAAFAAATAAAGTGARVSQGPR
ncbi:hypothetical protein WJX81_008184 [Elliptochloris bilobata]|uniref:Uncharacterized protein n=1 Tax=Elliptochloris bilobata TaxID=381761 RepID=A0AAW1S6D6_9CHLO